MSPDGSLRCFNADQVVLLLKSSDRTSLDVEEAVGSVERLQGGLSPLYLVLTKYYVLNASSEFRCFVKDKALVGAPMLEYACRLLTSCWCVVVSPRHITEGCHQVLRLPACHSC